MFTNADLQQMVTKFGDRICAIGLNNGKTLLIGYRGKNSTQLSDISFETVGGCDCLKVKKTDISSGQEVHFTSYITTEFIEYINVMDEDSEQWRVDPLLLS